MLVSRDVFQEQMVSEISGSTMLHFCSCNKIGLLFFFVPPDIFFK